MTMSPHPGMLLPMSRITDNTGVADRLVDSFAAIRLATVLASAAGEPVDGDDEDDDGVDGGYVVHVCKIVNVVSTGFRGWRLCCFCRW
jgi:hypothetical protein